MKTGIAVRFEDVWKKYGVRWALREVTISIEDGEAVAVLGPNGAGKSTLLKLVSAQIIPSKGGIWIYGTDILKNSVNTKRLTGFVGHGSFLYDELSIEENLRFYGRMFGVKDIDAVMGDILDMLGIDRLRDEPVKALSHGLRKRAEIARALLHSPSLLVLDEPFAGLDENTVGILIDYLREHYKGTILISSHSHELAKQVCSRIIFLNKGKIVSDSKG